VFNTLLERSSSVQRVNKWYRHLPYTRTELLWAYAQVNRTPQAGTVELELPSNCISREAVADPIEWGDLVASLSATYGLPPEHFMGMNESLVVGMWNTSDRTPVAAMLGSGQRQARKAKGGKSFLALGAAIREIAKRHGKAEAVEESAEVTSG
jgi:hypothetical protein